MTAPARLPFRRPRHRTLLLAVVVVALVVAALWFLFQRDAAPGRPPAFYTPPAHLPAGPPGTIIRREPIAGTPAGQQATRVLYTSTDPQGNAIGASGVIVAPSGDAPAGGWPVVAWAHGTTGIVPRCAPSLWPLGGIDKVPELDRLIAAGTVVAIADYPGLGTPGTHPYLVGDSEARSVLDSVRAAHSLLAGQVSDTTAVFGHSQGGHSALFVDDIAADYAPELDVVGVAAMAPPTDLGDLVHLDRNEPGGIVLTALALASWSTYYPDVKLTDVVKPLAIPLVEKVGQRCVDTEAEGIADAPDVIGLKEDFLSTNPAAAPGWGPHLVENSPSEVSATIPLLVQQGLTDDFVRPAVTTQFVDARCAGGASIEYQTYADTGHFQLRTTAAPDVVDWLLDRVQGQPAAAGCSTVAKGT